MKPQKIPAVFGILQIATKNPDSLWHSKLLPPSQAKYATPSTELIQHHCCPFIVLVTNPLLSELHLFFCAIFKIVTLLKEAIANHSKETHKNVKVFFSVFMRISIANALLALCLGCLYINIVCKDPTVYTISLLNY